ncbi:MAG: hypothetical protein M1828_005075 [Chrysothrix sp. TS-e1954]|nr:MAG: hypothetical protein M1828_005075 [Chrysothrix sp. TS-e1954]
MAEHPKTPPVAPPTLSSSSGGRHENRHSIFSQSSGGRRNDSPTSLVGEIDPNILIEFGETRAQLAHERARASKLEKDNERLRNQRDSFKKALFENNLNLPDLAFSDTSSVAGTPLLPFREPMQSPSLARGPLSGGGVPLPSPTSSMPSTMPGSGSLHLTRSTSQTLADLGLTYGLGEIHYKTDRWALAFTTAQLPPSQYSPQIGFMIEQFRAVINDDHIEEILILGACRRYMVAALINTHLSRYFGAGLLNNYRSFADRELSQLTEQLRRHELRKHTPIHHETIERRAALFASLLNTPQCQSWLRDEASRVATELANICGPLIPKHDHDRAVVELRTIVKECFDFSQEMIKAPKEWVIDHATRYSRFERTLMTFCNPDLHAEGRGEDAVTNDSFTIRFGVVPAITEISYASGICVANERQKKVVYLMRKQIGGGDLVHGMGKMKF